MEALNACLTETLGSVVMRLLFYLGLFNFIIVFVVFLVNGSISMDLVRKMRKFIFYSFVILAFPFLVALVKFLRM